LERFSNNQVQAAIQSFPPNQRLFTLRWVELFAHSSIEEFLCRPVWNEYVQRELISYCSAPDARKFHVDILTEELSVLPTASSISCDQVINSLSADPSLAAEMCAMRSLSFGFHPQFLYSASSTWTTKASA